MKARLSRPWMVAGGVPVLVSALAVALWANGSLFARAQVAASEACCSGESFDSYASLETSRGAQSATAAACECGGAGCKCAFNSCGKNGAAKCNCCTKCACPTKRCPKFSTTSDCTGFNAGPDGTRQCNLHPAKSAGGQAHAPGAATSCCPSSAPRTPGP